MRRLVLLSLATLASACAATAHAATYEVLACDAAPSGNHSGWQSSTTTPNKVQVGATCPSVAGDTAGLSLFDVMGAGNTPAGSIASWSLTTPGSLRIVRLRGRRYFGKAEQSWWVGSRVDGAVKETCTFDPMTQFQCSTGAASGSDANFDYLGLNAQAVDFVVRCDATAPAACVNGASLHRVWMSVPSAIATIDDPDAPSIGAIAGSAVGTGGTGGWHRGSEIATVSASDASGISALGLDLDGSSYAAATQACSYDAIVACPPSPSRDITIDWTSVADGPHQLRATATDAAGQTATGAAATVNVDTHPPGTPQSLAVVKQSDGTWRATWTNPNEGAGAPVVGATWTVCQPGSATSCVGGASHDGPGISALDDISFPPGGGPWDVRVWLRDAAGQQDPATAARVTVQTSPAPVATTPSSTDPPGKNTAGLRIDTLRRTGSRTLVLSGRIDSSARQKVTVQLRKRKTGPVFARYRGTPRRGRFSITFRRATARAAKERIYLTVTYPGDSAHAPARVGRLLTPKRASSKNGVSER